MKYDVVALLWVEDVWFSICSKAFLCMVLSVVTVWQPRGSIQCTYRCFLFWNWLITGILSKSQRLSGWHVFGVFMVWASYPGDWYNNTVPCFDKMGTEIRSMMGLVSILRDDAYGHVEGHHFGFLHFIAQLKNIVTNLTTTKPQAPPQKKTGCNSISSSWYCQ